MATFTWTATGTGGSTAWETTADWVDSSDSSNPTTPSFTTSPGNDYVINSTNVFTIGNIGAGGTNAPDIANSLTTQAEQFLLFANAGAFDVTTTLSLGGLMNLGAAVGGAVLSMGGASGGGTIDLGTSGKLEGALGDSVKDVGTSPTEIIGSGTVIAEGGGSEGGAFQIGTSVQVPTGTNLKFQIDANTTLSFADAVASGTVVFASNNNAVLDVAALSTFNASVKDLYVGTSKNDATNYIDFINVGTTASATLTNITTVGATLTVFTNGGSHVIPILTNYVGENAYANYVSDGNGGTNVFITDTPCYASGTAILTPEGEVAVETIQTGDTVLTCEADRLVPRTVIWTGVREIDLASHPKPVSAAPIRFRQGALGRDVPRRDLLVSPDHCLFIDGGLIPAKLLVNGMTIVRDLTMSAVCYHHIELERHAVLIAEGVEAESYLDTGNRAYFGNAGLATILHPEFAINHHLRCWESDACAPLVVCPDLVRPIWERFAARARSLGFAEPTHATTMDPGLRLMVDGRAIRPLAIGEKGRVVRFVVPEGAASIRLTSRRASPGEFRPWLDDPRPLGVAVSAFMLRDRTGEVVVGADHPALTDGWYAAEHDADGASWRWTGGDAALPIVSDGPCLLEIALSGTMTYPDDTSRLAA